MVAAVLCIDRRERNLATERRLLEVAGYEVTATSNQAEACELLERKKVDLVLISDDPHRAEHGTCAVVRMLQPTALIVLQRASTGTRIPAEVDLVIEKATNPKDKLIALRLLLTRRKAA